MRRMAGRRVSRGAERLNALRCFGHIQRKNYFDFGVQESLRTFLNLFFTGRNSAARPPGIRRTALLRLLERIDREMAVVISPDPAFSAVSMRG